MQETDCFCVYGWENYWNEQEMSSGKIKGGRGKSIYILGHFKEQVFEKKCVLYMITFTF